MNTQGFCDPNENVHCGRTFPALNSTNVIGVNVGFLCEEFLAQFRFLAILEHCFADDFVCGFGHRPLRKQNGAKVATHAPCRLLRFVLVS